MPTWVYKWAIASKYVNLLPTFEFFWGHIGGSFSYSLVGRYDEHVPND